MIDWSVQEWLTAVAAVATIVGILLTIYSLFRRTTKPDSQTRASTKASPNATVVAGSPHATVLTNSPGATIVHGDAINSVLGYSIEDHERIVNERVAQTREDLERAHQSEVNALQRKIDALSTETDVGVDAVRAVHAALSAEDYKRAQTLLAALEEAQIQGMARPALGTQVKIRTLRAEAALLSGDTTTAVEHFDEAASLHESLEPGQGSHIRNYAAQLLAKYSERFGGDGVEKAATLYRVNLEHWTRHNNPEEWAGTQNNLANAHIRLSTRETGNRALRHLSQAANAFRAALRVRTRDTHPADWAATQFNLGAALVENARRLGGDQATQLLDDAVEAFRAALQTLSQEDNPVRWSFAQAQPRRRLGRARQTSRRRPESPSGIRGRQMRFSCRPTSSHSGK